MPLDQDSAIPLYHQLFLQLRDEILSGSHQSGALLPSDGELERRFAVSRITVRRALDELRQLGLVRREHGRGTRVMPLQPAGKPVFGSVDDLIESNLAMGVDSEVDLLSFDYVPADDRIAGKLKLPHAAIVQRAARVRRTGRTPFAHLTTYVPEDIGRRFGKEELSSVPIVVLIEQNGARIEYADQTISAQAADEELAALLDVHPLEALIRLERTLYSAGDVPVEHLVAFYRPDVRNLRMIFHRNPPERRGA